MLVQLLLADAEVHLAPFQQLGRRGSKQLLESSQRFIELALLQQDHGGLKVLESRSRARTGVDAGFAGG
jgi:hypothetical protein